MMANQLPFTFEHDDKQYTGYAWADKEGSAFRIETMPHVQFRFDDAGADSKGNVRIMLPTDKPGATPYVASSSNEFPFLDDALDAARIALIRG